jgi:hypothetical protein
LREVLRIGALIDNPLPAVASWEESARDALECLAHSQPQGKGGPDGVWLEAGHVLLAALWDGTVEARVSVKSSRRLDLCLMLPSGMGEARSGAWWSTDGGVWHTTICLALGPEQVPVLREADPVLAGPDGAEVKVRVSPSLL